MKKVDPKRAYPGSPRLRPVQPTHEEDDDEEDVEIKLSPSGSVLMASPNPYDKMQRIREANIQLKQTKAPPQKTGKVRFNEKVILYSEDYSADPRHGRNFSPHGRPGQNKVLLVNVPTGFSEDNDDGAISDDGEEVSDESAFRWGQGGGGDTKHETSAVVNEEEIIHEIVESEHVDDLILERIEETPKVLQTEVKNLCNEMSVKCSLVVNKGSEVITDIKEVRERIQSANIKNRKNAKKDVEKRPKSAPSRRLCLCDDATAQQQKLPSYNGLRSEYGLSAEQLLERKMKRLEMTKLIRKEREARFLEERRRQKENDQMFLSWLVKKKKEAALKYARKKQQNSFYFKTLPAPTSHLDKMGVLRKKVLSKKEHTCYSLEEFFKQAKPHEQKTYRIYLGLCVD